MKNTQLLQGHLFTVYFIENDTVFDTYLLGLVSKSLRDINERLSLKSDHSLVDK